MTTEFRYVGNHADSLANGRPVEPGEFVELSDEDADANRTLVDEGKLLKIEGTAAGRRSASSKKKEEGD